MSCLKEETRSVSPHCPKPDESEEPLGTAIETGATADESMTAEVVITKEMEEEEKKLMEQGERKEEEMMKKARESWERDSHDMRFKRLQHLLQKSNIYSKFLLTKMEQQQNEERLGKEKLEKKAKKMQNASGPEAVKAEKKKRRRDEDYKIADVMSKEEIMSQAKKAKVEEVEAAPAQKKLEAEDIEKMSDSNQDIKNRLSETVRDNAKHLLHPHRKVNGQPVPVQQPQLFTGGVMRWYQIEGIEWLRMLWENGINGILADEMGLGKTIQCIGHIAMMIEKKVLGPFLVVAPLSTLPNWINEFKRFTPEVSVLLYHGSQPERTELLKQICRPQGPLSMCPVVITSFEISMIDRKLLQRFQWKYLIVDEGHRIKNLNCRLVRELKMLPTDNKLLLTGTPLQNNLAELWSLLNFLLPEVFDDLKSFESWFDINTLGEVDSMVVAEREQNILSMLHQILTPFLLRRLKSDVTLEVPPKKEIIVYAPLTAKQEAFYTAVVNKTIAKMLGQEKTEAPVALTSSGRPKRRSRKVVDYKETDTDAPYDLEKYLERVRKELEPSSHPVLDVQSPLDAQVSLKLQNILMLLKRCCNHPYLVEYPLDPATGEFKIDEQLVQSSGKFLILDRLLPALKRRGHKVLIFSQMTSILDILMDYCYLRGFHYSRLDGSMSYAERDENMARFSKDPEVFIFLLSTRAGGLGINLTAADTVIIFDSDWNPQADLQAQDRCHRIGQTKPVVVYRLVTANTIDQKILERASAKRKLEQMVIHKNKFKGGKAELKPNKSCIDLDELRELLKARGTEKEVKASKGKVISDKDLEILLDRSDLLDKEKDGMKKAKVGVFRVIDAKESSEITLG
ncbi:lymphoid-specific helicase isoform X1 [Pundamilia nyererei]|uniref:Proliferation-associated SNF2-like protein n=2 Tax=Haplochromini TaxID=319058 RepID=A0A9Y3VVI1_9CICH|nr:lymphoid-specific helicase isoform X1 [Maylandia zebra]XP_005749909.1 PREDICTED: lymphoid-specific helicase isoform X1 [Pundamilia nyererei]XP_026046313.1 lymphoid-specific helicase isoform X1 [Astatotilapia calliptera]